MKWSGASSPWDPARIATPSVSRSGRAIASPGRTRPAARVSIAPSLRSRRCASTAACSRMYMYESMTNFPHLLGGFSEYGYVMPEAGRVRVPDNVPNELASLSSCAFRSVMNAKDVLGGIGTTETVVVPGAGPLGLLATAVAKNSGGRRLVTIGAAAAPVRPATALR